jgi:hypothetical protein
MSKYNFFKLLNDQDLSAEKLGCFFLQLEKTEQILLIKEYFATFRIGASKEFNIDNTLAPIQKLNQKLKLYEIINQTPGLAYNILSNCDTLEYLQWVVEKMHINPLATSESRKIYVRTGSTNITNPRYMSGKYMSVLSINTGNDSSFLLSPTTAPDSKHLSAIKEEIIYKYIGKKNKKDLVVYLLSVGCAKDVLDKKITTSDKIKNISKDAFLGTTQLSILGLLICYFFFSFDSGNIFSTISIAIVISLLASWHHTYTISKQFSHVKKYLLNIK